MTNTNAKEVLIKQLPTLISNNVVVHSQLEAKEQAKLNAIITNNKSNDPTGLPKDYEHREGELFCTKGNGTKICSTPVLPYCIYTNSTEDGDLGVGIQAANFTGKILSKPVMLDAFGAYGKGVNNLISAGIGLPSMPQAQAGFEYFIKSAMKSSLPKVLVAKQMGFVGNNAAFLHGDMPLVQQLDGFATLQPAKDVGKKYQPSGSHDEWMSLIKENVKGCQQVFALSAAFASMLLDPAELDSCVFHFQGGSTTGKTILLQLAMSVHGSGCEPGQGDSNILRWNTTNNALERALADNSGLLSCIDELGALSAKGFSNILYNISSGTSKGRMNSSLGLQENFTWRSIILSTGEMSIMQKLESGKEPLPGGLEHRAISIEVEQYDAYSLLEDEDVAITQVVQWADNLKSGLSQHYGHAGKLFMSRFLTQKDDEGNSLSIQQIFDNFKQMHIDATQELLDELAEDGYELTGIQRRAMKRFGLVLLSGRLAVEWNILPFDEGTIESSIYYIVTNWLDDESCKYSPETIFIIAFRSYLLRRLNNAFPTLGIDNDSIVPNQAGVIMP
ncbi:DUF927 domain-containing protein [Rosenbergiella epipactidis]|uniref:DUF927 domain-containing protein n=1 Tax=Rosenbergiella epipactidis TaxID=1544694 RepID=UPI001F4EE1B4|nr:DUF927 domain-containing protein [Rosenbergiella epipactidis]